MQDFGPDVWSLELCAVGFRWVQACGISGEQTAARCCKERRRMETEGEET